jgi:formylglycine-generating enzyme required for sulfatase activity
VQALVLAGAGYWKGPYGEPEWVEILAGEFRMGVGDDDPGAYPDEKPLHKVHLPGYAIARTPVSNAQYALFVKASGHTAPAHFEDGAPPRGREAHPVTSVSWEDSLAYCAWLSQATGRVITLPSEAQWEKAARGMQDALRYPWGDDFDPLRCNSGESGIRDTTPVGIYLEGASPYGVLDLSGNVWEWTHTLWGSKYHYDPADGREDLQATGERVVRGGSFYSDAGNVRCAFRNWFVIDYRSDNLGFRPALLSPLPLGSGNSETLGL